MVVRLEPCFVKVPESGGSYVLLLGDEYPSTDEEQAVYLDIPYPDV